MTPKEYLKQVRRLDILIDNKLGELDNLRHLALSLSGAGDDERVASSTSGDRLEIAVSRIVDKEREIDALIDYYVDTRSAVLRRVEQIEDPALMDVLYRRYFKYQKWETIAFETHWAYGYVHELHNRALAKLAKQLTKSDK